MTARKEMNEIIARAAVDAAADAFQVSVVAICQTTNRHAILVRARAAAALIARRVGQATGCEVNFQAIARALEQHRTSVCDAHARACLFYDVDPAFSRTVDACVQSILQDLQPSAEKRAS